MHSRDTYAEVHDGPVRGGQAEVVPLFGFVYHHAALLWANYPLALRTAHRTYHRLALARALVWGELPNVRVEGPPDGPAVDGEALAFLGRVARARATYASPFLVEGTMLADPAPLASPLLEVRAPEVSKGVLSGPALLLWALPTLVLCVIQ